MSVFGHCWGQPILDVFHRAPTFGNRVGRIDRSVGRSACARRSDRPKQARINRLRRCRTEASADTCGHSSLIPTATGGLEPAGIGRKRPSARALRRPRRLGGGPLMAVGHTTNAESAGNPFVAKIGGQAPSGSATSLHSRYRDTCGLLPKGFAIYRSMVRPRRPAIPQGM